MNFIESVVKVEKVFTNRRMSVADLTITAVNNQKSAKFSDEISRMNTFQDKYRQ